MIGRMMRRRAALAIAGSLAPALPALAVDQLVEDFPAPGLGGWGGGSESYVNPGTGGVGGAGDGFLQIANVLAPGRFAVRNTNLAYIGDYPGAGVRRVMFYLNDVGAPDDLEIHFGIGFDQSNFWLYDVPLAAPSNEWKLFVIDIENADFTQWSQIGFGAETEAAFQSALASVGRVLLRHDDYSDGPDSVIFNDDTIAGDLGMDRFIIAIDCSADLLPGPDCNENGILDECDIAFGTSTDDNGNAVPDECEGPIDGDVNGDGVVNTEDLLALLAAWGPCPDPPAECPADFDDTGSVGSSDLLILLANWG